MKPEELMIGNYFNSKRGESKVSNIETYPYVEGFPRIFDEDGYVYEPSQISPIPLDEQWLLDFGFEKETDHYYSKYGIGFIIGYNNEGLVIQNSWGPRHVHIYEVHKLQNLFFSLCGKKLEIND